MADEFIVQSAIPERLYVKIYHDFLDSELLNGKEKLVFILLKRYLNFKDDSGGIAGKAYPTLETLSKQTGTTKKTVADIIKKLERKGIIEIKQQGLNRPNIYIIRDFSGIWKSKTDDEVKAAIDTYEEEYEDFLMIERLRNKGYRVIKEKEPDTSHADQSNDESSTSLNQYNIDNNIQKKVESQERYSLDELKKHYDYDLMIRDFSSQADDIDSVLNILHTVLNTNKPTIRIAGSNIPAEVVIGKLMKLDYSDIMYAIEKYQERTDRIKSPAAYMLTSLYNAKEYSNLDVTNQVQHDMANWKPKEWL